MDSQSVKTTGVGGEERGYDGAKKAKRRKRHILVDTVGFVLRAKVHSAKVMDHEGISARFAGVAEEVGGRTHVLLDRPKQKDEQGLRETNREQRGVHLRGDESYDGKEIGLLMSCSDRFRRVILRTSRRGF